MTTTSIDHRHSDTRTSPDDYIASVASEGELFARTAENGRLDVPIATCPGWNMGDLVRHLGEIHLWAAANVAFPKPTWLSVGDLTDLGRYWPNLASRPPNDHELVSWYRATHANLVDVLEAAPLDVDAFTFLPARTPLTMWARRQASEIAIHRFDAEHARGLTSHFEPEFAGDMLDELLSGFAPLYRGGGPGAPRVMRVTATDLDEHWWLTIEASGVSTSRRGLEADLTVVGTAAELYLDLWNRPSGSHLDVDGDPAVLDMFRDACRVVWSG